jgi:hypothetical protein
MRVSQSTRWPILPRRACCCRRSGSGRPLCTGARWANKGRTSSSRPPRTRASFPNVSLFPASSVCVRVALSRECFLFTLVSSLALATAPALLAHRRVLAAYCSNKQYSSGERILDDTWDPASVGLTSPLQLRFRFVPYQRLCRWPTPQYSVRSRLVVSELALVCVLDCQQCSRRRRTRRSRG